MYISNAKKCSVKQLVYSQNCSKHQKRIQLFKIFEYLFKCNIYKEGSSCLRRCC